jgi:hypothetical protein
VTFLRRNRIISVRVSDEEYQQVERISRERGAHSVSAFVRSILTTWSRSIPSSEPCTSEIMAQVAALQRQVDSLSDVVKQGLRPDVSTTPTDEPLDSLDKCLASPMSLERSSVQEA